MEGKISSSTAPDHPAIARCNVAFTVVFAILIPSILVALAHFYGEFQRTSSAKSWTRTTATVTKVDAHRLPKSRGYRLTLQLHVPGRATFEDSFPPMPQDFAYNYKKEIEETHKVDIYKSVGQTPAEYTLSYKQLANQRWMPFLLLIGGFGGLSVYGLIRFWGVCLDAISVAAPASRKFPTTRRLGKIPNPNRRPAIDFTETGTEQADQTVKQKSRNALYR